MGIAVTIAARVSGNCRDASCRSAVTQISVTQMTSASAGSTPTAYYWQPAARRPSAPDSRIWTTSSLRPVLVRIEPMYPYGMRWHSVSILSL